MSEKEIDKEMKELIIARLKVMPPNLKLSIGNEGAFTKEKLIEHVNLGDELGIKVIEMQMSFIRALTNNTLINTLNKNE